VRGTTHASSPERLAQAHAIRLVPTQPLSVTHNWTLNAQSGGTRAMSGDVRSVREVGEHGAAEVPAGFEFVEDRGELGE
jgi:hypothetical protein